jgi:epoxyqueuosine reductase
MPEDIITEGLFSYANNAGYELRLVSPAHLKEPETEPEKRRRAGGFNKDYIIEQLTSPEISVPEILPEGRSVILIAVPQPITLLLFRFDGIDRQVCIPPGYDVSVDSLIEKDLKDILTSGGFRIERATQNLKQLAVRSGMAEYGRNNMCYIPGKGSYFRFVAFCSDLPFHDEPRRPSRFMERCSTCRACISACPTGAIDENGFLFHSELCIAFHNEHAGSLPGFIKPSYHNCLLGCLKCQNACPENKQKPVRFEIKEEFSEYETMLIMNNKPLNTAPFSMQRKLERLNIISYYPILSRYLIKCLHSR